MGKKIRALLAIDALGRDRTIVSATLPADKPFDFGNPYNNTAPVTRPCRLEATVRPPEAARTRKRTVWSGRCHYLSGYVG